MGGASCCPIPWPSGPRVSRETTHNDTAEDEDDLQLLKLGYRAELARAWVAFDNVTFSFAALHCIGGIRVFFYIVLSAGGPAAMYVLMIIVFVDCNSQYEGGAHGINLLLGMPFMRRRQGCRFVSFLAAALTLVAWTSFLATDSFGVANYAISHVVFLAGFIVVVIDILLNRIWLPIGVSKTYGFRPAEYGFTSTYNGGGMAPSLNWILSWYLPARCLVGQHASGHIAEETVTARKSAANGVFWSTVASSLCGLHYHPLPVLHAHDRNIPRRSVPQPFININILAGLSGGREYESNHQSFIQIIVVTLAIPIVGLHG
ncbi:hypothetical protein KXW98_002484 [Aspergillus fumigatus]|uniref:Uncharacterized protein n=1 Tax=Aspergillus fumigatus TaxID=746128 RepID=A0A8H4IDN6_ASPFM|nr:hypothetical protein CNMCM8686_002502 [Aspergillus fumigatus]KAH1324215.1 hypothetical protein KXX66_006936 [Aspergillus fumigatus]KAH1371516.1 hypothetical protein KXX14_003062 [Aspergillus fumigatus]KAH1389968.1 hypothetical protein KXX10_008636 [Aspergillus fumigatus]KAH1415993.1 hypothetical protein KXX22_005699 [Aspergillus fumigatus]